MGTAILDRNLALRSEVVANFMLLSCGCKICRMCTQGDIDSGIHGTLFVRANTRKLP